MTKISLIVPIYNAEKYIEKCLLSIINQTYKNLEIIVINDGSIDDSGLIVKKFSKEDLRIKYYEIENHGVSYARNYGIEIATSDYLMFVDADDIIDSKMCEVLLNNIIENNADLSVCSYKEIYEQKLFDVNVEMAKLITEEKYDYLFQEFKGFLCNKLYKKSIIKKYNLDLNENVSMCEDLLFNFEYFKHVKRICYTKSQFYGYLINGNNVSKKIDEKWFSILYVYNYLYLNSDNLDLHIHNIVSLNYLFTLFETKVRCEILEINFQNVCQQYNVNYMKIKIENYSKIMNDKTIRLKDKMKLFLFYNVYCVAFLIKKKKLLKGRKK